MDEVAQTTPTNSTGGHIIFLVGLPGVLKDTVRQLLGSAAEIQAAHEDPWLMLPLLYLRRETGCEAEYNQTTARIRTAQFLVDVPEGEIRYTEGLRRFAHDLYLARLDAQQRYVLDASDRYYHIIPELKALLPDARLVFIVGNPLDPVRAILQDKFRGYFPALYQHDDIYRDLYIGPKALAAGLTELDDRCFVLTETALASEESRSIQLAQLSAFLNLANPIAPETWNELQDTARYVTAAGLPPLPRQPIDTNYIDAASQYLEHLGNTTLNALGYDHNQLRRHLHSEYIAPIVQAFIAGLPVAIVEPLFGDVDALAAQLLDAMLADPATILGKGAPAEVPQALRGEIAESVVWLGEQRYGENDEAGALDAFRLAAELNPACTRAYSNQAVILHQRGEVEAAMTLLFDSHNANPKDATTLANLCALLKETGRIAEGQQLAMRFLTEHPDNDEAMKIFIDMN